MGSGLKPPIAFGYESFGFSLGTREFEVQFRVLPGSISLKNFGFGFSRV